MILERCLCGDSEHVPEFVNGFKVALCACGHRRLVTDITREEYEGQYLGDYHRAVDRHPGCVPYRARYDHDYAVAGHRWRRYHELLPEWFGGVRTALDVGAANGAFVNYLADLGLASFGVDPDPAMRSERVATGRAADMAFEFDLVTYHDVLEHTVDPRQELAEARRLVRPGGLLVVDVPDVSVEAGRHHYKPEHLWYFNSDGLSRLLAGSGFEPLASDKPVPGKLVLHSCRVS